MRKFINDFLLFRKMWNNLDVSKLSDELKLRIREVDDSYEKQITEVLLFNLARKMIKEDIPSEFAAGFKTALMIRQNLKALDSKGVLTNDK